MRRTLPIPSTRQMIPFGVLALVAIAGLTLALLRSGVLTSPSPIAQQLSNTASQRPVNLTDRTIWDAQEVLRENPDSTDSYALLGIAYLQKAREVGDPSYYGKAEAVFAEALKRDPQHIDALIGQGTLLLARHQFREGLAIGQKAAALNPNVPRIYGVIADAQTELGMYDEAIQTIQKMVDMRPDLSSYSRVSYARELHGDLEGAIEAMQMAVQAGGPSLENTEWTRVQLANLYFANGDLATAEQVYNSALTGLKDYVPALAGMGRVRAAQGKTAEAISFYKQAIERMPLPEYVIALGELQEATGHADEAAKQYQLVAAMQQLFKSNGVDTDLELALFEADHGKDPQAALALARAAYERRPSVKAADTLAWAFHQAGQNADARHYVEEALRLDTKDALMLYHAGMIAQAQGDHKAAHDYLSRALALNPHFSPLYAPRAEEALKVER